VVGALTSKKVGRMPIAPDLAHTKLVGDWEQNVGTTHPAAFQMALPDLRLATHLVLKSREIHREGRFRADQYCPSTHLPILRY